MTVVHFGLDGHYKPLAILTPIMDTGGKFEFKEVLGFCSFELDDHHIEALVEMVLYRNTANCLRLLGAHARFWVFAGGRVAYFTS